MAGFYQQYIEQAAMEFKIPAVLIESVIQKESSGNQYAVGTSGEKGLMQLMPTTAKYLGVLNPFNPQENIRGGSKFLSELYGKYGNWRDALSHYNAGFNLGAGRGYADSVINMVAGKAVKNPSLTPVLDTIKRGDDPTKDPVLQSDMAKANGAEKGGLVANFKKWLAGEMSINDLLKNIAADVGLWIVAFLFIILGIWRLVNA